MPKAEKQDQLRSRERSREVEHKGRGRGKTRRASGMREMLAMMSSQKKKEKA
jgi:hypothetical protein